MTPEQARKLIDGIDERDKFDMWEEFPDRYDPYTVYDLAETVAGLRYEYAVQGLDGGEWKFTGFDGKVLEPSESERIAWWNRAIPKRDIADRGAGWRIVRRLVSDVEVVE